MIQNPWGENPFEYETDRARFLGRGRTWRDPVMSLNRTDGYVLDPVFVLETAAFRLTEAAGANRRWYGRGGSAVRN